MAFWFGTPFYQGSLEHKQYNLSTSCNKMKEIYTGFLGWFKVCKDQWIVNEEKVKEVGGGGRKDLLHKLHLICVKTLVPGLVIHVLASTICLGIEIKARSPSADVVEAKSHQRAQASR